MRLTEIAAIGKNNELGKDNHLIWHIKEDMKFFQEQTQGHPVLMGRKTFDSLPKMLPGRHHIVISRSHPNYQEEVEVFDNIDDFFRAYQSRDIEIFIIGGAQIYQQFLPYANRLLLTEIDDVSDADVYFPLFDASLYSRTVLDEGKEDHIEYQFVEYRKK